ncbi:hypothetical protein B7435_29630 [Mycolicibacterium peregrinum]|nr:hypothetical protein B7435_29630 [Mycolicibacterium peregrinum]
MTGRDHVAVAQRPLRSQLGAAEPDERIAKGRRQFHAGNGPGVQAVGVGQAQLHRGARGGQAHPADPAHHLLPIADVGADGDAVGGR